MHPKWAEAIQVADEQSLLQAILGYLDGQKAAGLLNNNGIPRMVRGYFYEMACVIAECARVLKPNAPLLMINDNVRYAGASISVDMILSAMAEKLGFFIENILMLPGGKGNSSQQMGEHGRETLRKCLYVWRKVEKSNHPSSATYIALGELKGGIDPAGADEPWKTARIALERISQAFAAVGHAPSIFFIGAAIERKMATEIWSALPSNRLTNAANLNADNQLASIASWLCSI